MSSCRAHIRALENYLAGWGVRIRRSVLPPTVHGRLERDMITLRAGMRANQELAALIHEVTHWLVHREATHRPHPTVAEYEAEAVESLVMIRLGLPKRRERCPVWDLVSPTDNLLFESVLRVKTASTQICQVLGADAVNLQPQAAVDVETAPREEIVVEYELYGMGDFLGLPEAL
jgi:hypothetical protein